MRFMGTFGADEEIRTLETVIAVYTISNRAPSASSDTSAYNRAVFLPPI